LTDTFRKILGLLDVRERRDFWLLTLLMALVAIAEVGSVSAVLLLLNALSDPATLVSNRMLGVVGGWFGVTTQQGLQILLASIVTAVVVAGLAVKAMGSYAVTRFAYMRTHSISTRMLGAYLRQPYGWFLERNSAEVGKNVLSEVDGVVSRVIFPLVKMMANCLLVLCIVGFLMLVDPLVTLLSAGLLGGSYAVIYLLLRGRIRRTGEDMMAAYEDRFRIAQEATGGIKDVKLMALEAEYTGRYSAAAHRSALSTMRTLVMGEMPRYALEAITFGTLLVMVLVLLVRNDGQIAAIIPTLGIFALSVMRLLPALQQIYYGLSSIRSATAIVDALAADYAAAPVAETLGAETAQPRLQLDRRLELRDISFRYPSAKKPALSGLTLAIDGRTTIGFVGGTGAGKTTLVDLVLGLLTPDRGELVVDGTPITADNIRRWQKSLGYVPQAIYLTDDTIAANIAFGLPRERIDMAAVERAARAAALHDFVRDLPDGYETRVGERGVRLSGGQRQRIGIARALYGTPSLLIMDEATSALDNITERVVMEAVQNLRSDTTIILIAHRLTTVRGCDRIYLLEKGKVAASGTYDELVAGNATFRAMAVGE